MSNKIFIGWDSRFKDPARVLAWSLKRYSSIDLDIHYLHYDHLNHVYDFDRDPDPLASTEFTYSRFLVPYLCDYNGKAIFMDNDMLCFSDIKELFDLPMDNLALRVVKHDHKPTNTIKMYGAKQTSYPRKNWSSLMVMNCNNLLLWTKDEVEHASGAYLHRFQDIPDDSIGDIPPGWNILDESPLDENTKLYHWTNGGPWYEEYKDCPHADVWNKAYKQYKKERLLVDKGYFDC